MLKTRKEGGVILQTFCISMVAVVLFATDLLMGKRGSTQFTPFWKEYPIRHFTLVVWLIAIRGARFFTTWQPIMDILSQSISTKNIPEG